MNVSEIKELIEEVSKSKLTSFEYSEGNISLSLKKEKKHKLAEEKYADVIKETEEANENEKLAENSIVVGKEKLVKSPLVGTVYLSDKEGGDPLVKVGDNVEKGQTLAIVEAMKLMNEINSEFSGVIKKVLVEDADTVEYGQPIFEIE